MDTQERDVILNRILAEMSILFNSHNGLTVKEIARKLRDMDPDLDFNERTIRRDCQAFEYHGLVEPRKDEGGAGTWRVKASDRMERWCAKLQR